MSSNENNPLIHLPKELLERILVACGPVATARCAQVCQKLYTAVHRNQKLWCQFVELEVRGCQRDNENCDWEAIYTYLYHKQRQFSFSVGRPLVGHVVFADDGGAQEMGNPLRHGGNGPYSTGTGVTKNVDLIVDLGRVCLVTGFAAANHCRRCSGPLKEALVFFSLNPPDLDHARMYDDKNGKILVNLLETSTTETKDAYLEFGKLNREGTVSSTLDQQTQPVAALRLRSDGGYYCTERVIRHCKPTIGRYIHFKLLGIYNPYRRPESENNIDVNDLLTFGIALPELPGMRCRYSEDPSGSIPEYRCIHERQDGT